MERSPFFDSWKSCPRCTADLEIAESRATCPACGLVVYANPAPTVSALLFDEDGRVMLARRAADPGRGLWDLLGGFMHEGELPLETLVRELREETSLEIEPLEFFGAWPDRYGEGGVWTLNLYWTAGIRSGTPTAADDVAEVAWFAAGALPPWEEFAFENTVAVLRSWESGR